MADTETNSAFRHPEGRKVIFLGDYIDRGPEIRETLRVVRAMVDAGTALAIMGNHEFNALAYHTPNGRGGHLREHEEKNIHQHAETVRQVVEPYPEEWRGWLEWFSTLPLFLDLGNLRAVHAAWDPEAVAFFKTVDRVHGEHLRLMAEKGTPLRLLRENLINGVEVALPVGIPNPDKEGVERDGIRTKWWNGLKGKTYRQVVFPDNAMVTDALIPEAAITGELTYTPNQPPVFFGHYWMPADTVRAPLAPNVAVLDYSVARGGDMTAYRWDGEVCVPHRVPRRLLAVRGGGGLVPQSHGGSRDRGLSDRHG